MIATCKNKAQVFGSSAVIVSVAHQLWFKMQSDFSGGRVSWRVGVATGGSKAQRGRGTGVYLHNLILNHYLLFFSPRLPIAALKSRHVSTPRSLLFFIFVALTTLLTLHDIM